MNVDELMDLANVAVEDILGRPFSYVPPGGGAAIQLVGDYQRAPKTMSLDDVDHSTYDPRIDVRQSSLTECGVTLKQNGIVTLESFGATETYKIIDVQQSAPGSVIAVLGRKS